MTERALATQRPDPICTFELEGGKRGIAYPETRRVGRGDVQPEVSYVRVDVENQQGELLLRHHFPGDDFLFGTIEERTTGIKEVVVTGRLPVSRSSK